MYMDMILYMELNVRRNNEKQKQQTLRWKYEPVQSTAHTRMGTGRDRWSEKERTKKKRRIKIERAKWLALRCQFSHCRFCCGKRASKSFGCDGRT